MNKGRSVLLLGLISTLLLSGSLFSGLMPITVFATSDEEATQQDTGKEDNDGSADSTQDTQPQEADTHTDNQTSEEQQPTSEPTSPSIAVGEPNPCAKPDDGRPQDKGANADAHTWKVVSMKDDPSLFKVVDSAGINVADQFHSEANAKQYISYSVCNMPSPTPTNTGPVPPVLPNMTSPTGGTGGGPPTGGTGGGGPILGGPILGGEHGGPAKSQAARIR